MNHLDADLASFVFLFMVFIAYWIVNSHLLHTHTHTFIYANGHIRNLKDSKLIIIK